MKRNDQTPTTKSKPELKRQTLRRLDHEALAKVAGGHTIRATLGPRPPY